MKEKAAARVTDNQKNTENEISKARDICRHATAGKKQEIAPTVTYD